MAARYAVTTGDWTAAIWAATAGGAAGSAAVPTSADDVTINKNVTVTINDATAAALTLTLSNGTTGADVGAILTCATGADTKLTLERNIITTPSTTASYMSSVLLDVSSTNVYKFELQLTNSGSTTSAHGQNTIAGNYLFKGYPKTRHTVLTAAISAGATTATVADATGWKVGDTVVFATTEAYNATPRTDSIVLNGSYTPGSTTLTWTGGTTYAHAADCPVGNLSSNCRVIGKNSSSVASSIMLTALANGMSQDGHIDSVEFYQCTNPLVMDLNSQADNSAARHKSIKRCAFTHTIFNAIYLKYLSCKPERNFNVFYSTQSNCTALYSVNTANKYGAGPDEDYVIFRHVYGISFSYPDQHQRRHKISGLTGSTTGLSNFENNNPAGGVSAADVEDCDFWSNNDPPRLFLPSTLRRCRFDSKVFPNATSGSGLMLALRSSANVVAIDCEVPTSFTIESIGVATPMSILLNNKNADPEFQEYFQYQSTTVAAIRRNTSTVNRSTSSMEFTLNSATAQPYDFEVLAKAGETIKLLCYVQINAAYDDAAYTYPSITVSGLGITPVSVSATSASVGAWELLELNATNTGSADGNLTVTLSAQSATANAKAYFSGLPVSPFVSRCRHYGYVFNETGPTRTVDTVKSADFATADAYSGMSITWGASASSVALTGDTTFQKLYDYHQAKAAQNVGSALALTGAGVAGSPALFAAGNVTTNGYTLNGNGSMSMGSYTLAATIPWAYTYTGGTFSQASTVPTFAGGQLNLGAAGTYTFTMAAATIVSMTPTAPGTYAMGDASFTGQVDLRNTSGTHAITVELPSGTSYTTANNTGAAITISTPQTYQSVTLSGVTAGSRVQIYDTTHSVELFNGTSGYSWTDGTPAIGSRAIRIRVAKVSGATAKDFLEANIGTCGVTEPSNALNYLVTQVDDVVYNANAINGSTVTGITFTDAATDVMNINIAAGAVNWKSIYAAWVWYAFDVVGITTDIDYIDAVDTANYTLSNLIIKNTSSPSVPLEVTGGYGRDSVTGATIDLVDTTGGTLIFAPDHVVSYAVGSGVTSQDITDIAAATAASVPSAATIATEVWNKTLP